MGAVLGEGQQEPLQPPGLGSRSVAGAGMQRAPLEERGALWEAVRSAWGTGSVRCV